MRPRQSKHNHNPAEMTPKEIKRANAIQKRMLTALAKDRAEREER